MGFSPLADMSRRIPDIGRSNSRGGTKITGIGIHHNAGVNAYGMATRAGEQVSAHYWITNEGVVIPNIDEDNRAWTSGHDDYPAGRLADLRNITFEVSNSRRGDPWPISDKAMRALIRMIADVYKRHGLGTVRRGANSGVGIHSDWVDTECPGDYIRSKLDYIISEANKINSGGLTMADIDELKKLIREENAKVYDHITYQMRTLKGSSELGWVKTRLMQLLLRDDRIDIDIDPAELAVALKEAFGDDLAAAVAPLLTITTKEA